MQNAINEKKNSKMGTVDLIGFHGQTIFHDQKKNFQTIRRWKFIITINKKNC